MEVYSIPTWTFAIHPQKLSKLGISYTYYTPPCIQGSSEGNIKYITF